MQDRLQFLRNHLPPYEYIIEDLRHFFKSSNQEMDSEGICDTFSDVTVANIAL